MGHKRTVIGLACAALLGSGMLVGISQAQDAPPSSPPGAAPSLPHERGPGPDFRKGPGGPGAHRFDDRDHMRGGSRGARFEPGKHIEGRVAFLKAELKITDAQARAWDQYANFMRETAKTRQAEFEKRQAEMKNRPRPELGQRREAKPLLERLEERETRAKAMLQSVEKRKAATQALYKVLNDEQKKLAEDLL
ncbi:MAG: Spy/CpxP family protein refolding chaperone [Proteobacteria bacterium]|nr:Spy/CpxP family protein refolding chaperone [Pseudomonadota bacterium]